MNRLSDVLNTQIKGAYLQAADSESEEYLRLTNNEKLDLPSKLKMINDVYSLAQKHGLVENEKIQSESLKTIQSSFRKGFEDHNFQLKLLELLICIIEKKTGITAPPISHTCHIRQDLPLLKPDDFLMSRLQSKIYELIEDESMTACYLDNPKQNQAVLILWLVLKEGFKKSKDIEQLLSKKSTCYRIGEHWLVETKGQRYWLSPMAELLLTAYWNDSSKVTINVMSEINKLLHDHRIVPRIYSLRFVDLRSAFKYEFVLTVSPAEYSICQSSLPTTSLTQASLYRLLLDKRVKHCEKDNEQQKMPVRQKVAWLSAGSTSAEKLRKKTILTQEELTTAEQMKVIEHYTDRLIKTPLKESIRISNELQDELRPRLESNDIAASAPWGWIVLSWMYQLLKFGGKHKKRLRLTTIKSYISYVAAPFIQEFSGCAPKKMDSLDWAEKLNIVAEQVTSSKKAFVLYFAEFLIESDIVTNLCLSDIDIPSIGHRVNANIITHVEAERIIKACDSFGTPTAKIAKLCFYLGFYSGLRRGEVAGLQFADFTINGRHYANLHVRPNKYRELKSSESSRNLPLDCLLPDIALVELTDYLNITKTTFTQEKSLIFKDTRQLNEAFSLLTEIMKIITAEPQIRYHHCRHSFCNWTWIRLNYAEPSQLTDISFCQHDFFSPVSHQRLCQRLAIAPFSRKKLWALSGLLGHSSPEVTTSSYFHLSELIQRTKFSNQQPSPFLLRRVWGQRIRINGHCRPLSVPASKRNLMAAVPATYQPPLDLSNIDEAITQVGHTKEIELKQTFSLGEIWAIIQLLAQGHPSDDIANLTGIDTSAVEAIVKSDESIMQTSLRRSKYTLPPLANYAKLNRGNVKTIESLIKIFQSAIEDDAIPDDFNFTTLIEILNDLVGAQDSLIRTHNQKAALLLIKLIQVMGLKERHVKLKWYFPSENCFNANQIETYKQHLLFWDDTIRNRIFSNMAIEIVVPKTLKQYIKPSTRFTITISDAGRFLKYHPPGTVSIHLLQSKFDHQRLDEEGDIIEVPQRTRAFITFLRLLAIYTKTKEATKNSTANDYGDQ
ncbi:tyrosine-type recombinase/integrase [Vibrio metschnikovii]|uniref:tyrosine-type recombinase/integrase n=1 Tax=Vibrio metschnikovii TaxID=28172 RepID=UPI001C2FFAA3|nr:tyrosine-type recombinase/integrase [Vibrio metschnikovii]